MVFWFLIAWTCKSRTAFSDACNFPASRKMSGGSAVKERHSTAEAERSCRLVAGTLNNSADNLSIGFRSIDKSMGSNLSRELLFVVLLKSGPLRCANNAVES